MKFPNTAKLLAKILRKNQITKRELAKRMRVSEQFIGQIAKGERGFPNDSVERLLIYQSFYEFERAAVEDFRKLWRESAGDKKK